MSKQISPVCLSPGMKSKPSACFFLLALIILSTVNHGPLTVLLYSVRLATLLPWDKNKGMKETGVLPSLFYHLVQEATEGEEEPGFYYLVSVVPFTGLLLLLSVIVLLIVLSMKPC